MDVNYSGLHRIKYFEEFKSNISQFGAQISHLGIKQIKSSKSIAYSKKLRAGTAIELEDLIAEQFEKWDTKWKGSYPGPTCDYSASVPTSPTGTPWRELEEYRNGFARKDYERAGVLEVTIRMLFTKHIPTYNAFFDIETPPEIIRTMAGLNFTAIDFETANDSNTSACAIGIAQVVDGQIRATRKWLVKPVPFTVNPINEGIHGISLYDLDHAQSFPQAWKEILPFLQDQLLVAHNCAFDLDKLTASLQYHCIDYIHSDAFCTMSACKKMWPEISSSLPNIADIFNIPLDHHDVLSDATACAELAIRLARLNNVSDLRDILSGKRSALPKKKEARTFERSNYNTGTDIVIEFELPKSIISSEWSWHQKRVVVSGVLANYERDEITQKLKDLGALVSSSISGITDVLLVGSNMGPSKIEKAKKHNVYIMDEAEFNELNS